MPKSREKAEAAHPPAKRSASPKTKQAGAAAEGLTQRFTILASPKMLRQLQQKAAASGVSKGELIRRAIDSYDPSAAEDEALVQALLAAIRQGTMKANRALDEAEEELRRTREYFAQRAAAAERA